MVKYVCPKGCGIAIKNMSPVSSGHVSCIERMNQNAFKNSASVLCVCPSMCAVVIVTIEHVMHCYHNVEGKDDEREWDINPKAHIMLIVYCADSKDFIGGKVHF